MTKIRTCLPKRCNNKNLQFWSLVKTFLSKKQVVTNKKEERKFFHFVSEKNAFSRKEKAKNMCRKVFDLSMLSFANSNNSQKETDCHAILHVILFS